MVPISFAIVQAIALATLRGPSWWIVHIGSAVAAAWLMSRTLGYAKALRSRLAFAALLALVAFWLPCVGLVFVAWPIAFGLAHGKPRIDQWWGLLEPVSLARHRAQKKSSDVTLASVSQILRSKAPVERRFRAVLATRAFQPKDAVGLLRLAMVDPAEEVRLLAHSRLSGIRTTIERRVQMRRHWLQEGLAKNSFAEVHHRLAEDYWELCYLDLLEGEAVTIALNRAAEAGGIALSHDTSRPATAFLLARVELRRGNMKLAGEFLELAVELGVPHAKVAPYLAELQFKLGEKLKVESLLNDAGESVCDRSQLSRVVEFWS